MIIKKIIVGKGEKPKRCIDCDLYAGFGYCPALCKMTNYGILDKNCPIEEEATITDPETLDNTLNQNP